MALRSDFELKRQKLLQRLHASSLASLGSQITARAPLDDTVITPDQIDTKVIPSMVDTSTITTETGVDYSKNPPDVWLKVKWQAIPNEDIINYELAIAPIDTNLWQFYTVEVTNAKYGAGFKYGGTQAGQLEYTIHGLQPGKQYRFKMRAQNVLGWWGDSFNKIEDSRFLTGVDTIPPPQFDINYLTLLAGAGFILGKITQEQQPDFKQWEVAASTNPGFTPDESTIKWRGYAHVFTFDFANTNTNGTTNCYIRVREVDTSGNEGAWSAAKLIAVGRTLGTNEMASDCVVARLIGANEIITNTANIADAIITDAKITNLDVAKLDAGTISGKVIVLATDEGDTRAVIQSDNYEYLVSGVYIDSDGRAEFNNCTVRGMIEADSGYFKGFLRSQHVVIDGDGSWSGTSLNLRYSDEGSHYLRIVASSNSVLSIGHATSPSGGSFGNLNDLEILADQVNIEGQLIIDNNATIGGDAYCDGDVFAGGTVFKDGNTNYPMCYSRDGQHLSFRLVNSSELDVYENGNFIGTATLV
jgi:hypothetical protein